MATRLVSRKLLTGLSLSCLIVWSLMGCNSMDTSTEINPRELRFSIDQFHTAVRWGAYDKALIFVSPSLEDDFSRLTDRLEGKIRITEFDVRKPRLDSQSKCGWVTVHFKLYRQNNPQLETKTIREQWCRADKGDLWQIVQHDFKELMQ